jgi:hypothetical protein
MGLASACQHVRAGNWLLCEALEIARFPTFSTDSLGLNTLMRLLAIFSVCVGFFFLSTQVLAGYVDGIYIYKPEDTQAEAKALKKFASIAKREGKILSLSLVSGKSVSFRNKDSCTGYEDCEAYLFSGLLPATEFFVVNVALYEGSNVYLVSKQTGARYAVYAEPHISPDGKHVVSASPAEAYNTNGLFLWEVRSGSLVQRFHLEPSTYALYRFSRWDGPHAVELMKFTNATKDMCPNSNHMELPVRLFSEKGMWQLDESSMKDKVQCR